MAASTKVRTVSECSDGATDCELLQELWLLEAIYIHELNVDYNNSGIPCELSVVLHPATADNVDQQYVCLTLDMKLPEQYPNILPEITIRNSRGISDEHLTSLDTKLKQLAEERQGGAMLYELIEVAKESLTNNNTPNCQCVICLHGFMESDVFTKTPCYHYFHSQCLARYLRHALENEEEPACAVCRKPVTYDLSQLNNAPAPSAAHIVYSPDEKIREMQRRMTALYRRQKEKGGIIDIEAESNKFLIDISQTPTQPLNIGISPATTQPQNPSERGVKTQNVVTSDKVLSKEEVISTGDSTRPAVPAGREDNHKGNYPECPRSSKRSNYKPGGRGWVRGRGSGSGWVSRGRGHARPYSSGAKDYYSKPSSVDGRDKFKGQSSNDKGSSEHHQDSEKTTHQSQDRMEHKKGVDQSKEKFENDNEKQLDNECKERNQQKLQDSRGQKRKRLSHWTKN